MKNLLKNNQLFFKYIYITVIVSLFITILEYIGISFSLLSMLSILTNLLLVFIFSYKNSKNKLIRGYKSGIKFGIKIWIILFIINVVTLNKLTMKCLLYYVIIMFISIIGAVIGKNKQKNYSS